MKKKQTYFFKVFTKWIILVVTCLFSPIITAQNLIYTIDESYSPDSILNTYIQIYQVTSEDAGIDYIKAKSEFEAYPSDFKFDKKGIYWARLKLQSKLSEAKELIIQIGNKRSSDFAEMYVYNRKDSLLKSAESGHFQKGSRKDIRQEQGSKFYINLIPNEVYTAYFKIKNVSGFKPGFELKVYDKLYFEYRLKRRNLVQGMLQGALWIMFLYNLFIFLYSRDKVYLYYSLYIIGVAINFVVERGLFVEYTVPEFPKFEPFAFVLVTGLATIGYFQFIRFFLHTKKHMPKWDKAHLIVVWINIFVTILLVALLFISFNVSVSINISNYLNLIGLLYGFVFIYFLIKKRLKLSGFFIAGSLVLAIGTFISLYFLITKKPLDFDPKYFMNVATIAELLIFSLGLGQRIRLIENSKQKVQEKLIEQLKKNERLKEKVNRELENKVKERTIEIEQQNEEIQSQSDNLKKANEILMNQKREIENKNEEITQQKRYLEKVYKSTTDSINYASRIQNVILPSENQLEKYFNEHFIFYRPKEIVSGDFYWYRYIERNNKRYFALCAADSTGHGVPGSLVSMLGISLLNETVVRNEVNTANQILEILREEVKTTFSHSEERLLTRDGIDMAFCIIELDSLKMQYAGANRPLLIIKSNSEQETQNGENGLLEIKPTKNPVGVYHKEKKFENHTIQLEKGDIIYLFSDGYADQVGGTEGRKFYFKRFKDLLTEIHKLPMSQQKQVIIQVHERWISHKFKGDNQKFRQVDDMLVMGIKI